MARPIPLDPPVMSAARGSAMSRAAYTALNSRAACPWVGVNTLLSDDSRTRRGRRGPARGPGARFLWWRGERERLDADPAACPRKAKRFPAAGQQDPGRVAEEPRPRSRARAGRVGSEAGPEPLRLRALRPLAQADLRDPRRDLHPEREGRPGAGAVRGPRRVARRAEGVPERDCGEGPERRQLRLCS